MGPDSTAPHAEKGQTASQHELRICLEGSPPVRTIPDGEEDFVARSAGRDILQLQRSTPHLPSCGRAIPLSYSDWFLINALLQALEILFDSFNYFI